MNIIKSNIELCKLKLYNYKIETSKLLDIYYLNMIKLELYFQNIYYNIMKININNYYIQGVIKIE